MATVYGIQKSVTLDSGFIFDHWGVLSVQLNPMAQKANVVFAGWKDFAARLSGRSPIAGQIVVVEMSFLDIGILGAMTNPLLEMNSAVLTYALANAEDLSGGQIVSQEI